MNPEKIKQLNSSYSLLTREDRLKRFYTDFPASKILVTSSFGSTSVALLHMISRIKPEQKIHFINTLYHFPETISYKEKLKKTLNLSVEDVVPEPLHHQYTRENKTWSKDPDFCCSVNKVMPFAALKKNADFWITGLIGQQNSFRNKLSIFTEQDNLVKFNPLIDASLEDIKEYISYYSLPSHPLSPKGYSSIGCTHCTAKGKYREGRWHGKTKTECGLHLPGSAGHAY